MKFFKNYKKLLLESEIRGAGLFTALSSLLVQNSKLKQEITEYEALVRELCEENVRLNNQVEGIHGN